MRGCRSLLDVLCFEGYEELSQPYRYTIEFTCTDKTLTPQQMLMQNASLTLQTKMDQGYGIQSMQPVRALQGVVTGFEHLSTSKDETHYALTLQPRLALLSRSHQNRIYQDMSVPQIVEHILRTRHDMRGQDFVFTLANEYPRREQVMQYDEDDLTFISRLLSEVGIWFRFTTDTRLNIDVVEFYDAQRHVERGLQLPSVPPSGQHDNGTESVRGLKSQHQVVEKNVFTRDYNYRNSPEDMNIIKDVTRGDSTTYGEAYHWASNYLTPGNVYQRDPEPESGAFYARLHHERYLNNQTRLEGETNCATIAPGQELKVTGGEEVTDPFRKGVVITQIHSRARRDKSFEVTFHGIPFSEDYCFRPASINKPVMAGTLPARVTSTKTNDIYGHIDRDGRYKVNLLFDRDNWQPGEESLWVRQSRPYAGETYGLHLPLLAGTEVAIAFEHGNPDRPYIAGVLHDSAHNDHVTIRNYKRNVLRTPANNKIRLDDSRGQEHIKISTEYGGKSQLNLGHLVDSEKQKRGEGFELRTDSYGVIRAGKGLFISTDLRAKAASHQLDMREAKLQLQDAISLTESLREAAEMAKAELADLSKQKALLSQSIDELKQAALLVSSPAGIAMTTPKTVQLNAGENLTFNASNQADFSVLKRITLAAGKAISLFARESGMKFFAAKGNVELQAQRDEMHLTSQKDMTVTSVAGKTIVAAKDELLLTCGGAYIRLKGGQIEYGSPGNQTVKATNWVVTGPESMDITNPTWPQSVPKQKLRFQLGGSPLSPVKARAGEPYKLYANGALMQQGITDENGNVEIDHLVATRQYRLELPGGEEHEIKMADDGQITADDDLAAQGFGVVNPTQTKDASGLGNSWRNTFSNLLNPQSGNDNQGGE